MRIKSPEFSLQMPLIVPRKLLMGAGPTNTSPRVKDALNQSTLQPIGEDIFRIMDEIKEGLKYLFQTKNRLTLVLASTAHGALETIFSNLLETGDKIVIGILGLWAQRAVTSAQMQGYEVHALNIPAGKVFSLSQIEEKLKEVAPKLFFIVQGDSTGGVLQPLEGLGRLCHKYNCLLAVDAVASMGAVPLYTDDWEIDIVFTGSQKVLSSAPGLCPITFSPRAEKIILTRKSSTKSFYFDLKSLGNHWKCFDESPRSFHYTMPCSLLYGLRESLALILEEGLENGFERHKRCVERLYEGLKLLDIKLLVEDKSIRLPTVTPVLNPEQIDWKSICEYLDKKYNLQFAPGLGPSAGAIRIGTMGYNATEENVDFVLQKLDEAFKYFKNQIFINI